MTFARHVNHRSCIQCRSTAARMVRKTLRQSDDDRRKIGLETTRREVRHGRVGVETQGRGEMSERKAFELTCRRGVGPCGQLRVVQRNERVCDDCCLRDARIEKAEVARMCDMYRVLLQEARHLSRELSERRGHAEVEA